MRDNRGIYNDSIKSSSSIVIFAKFIIKLMFLFIFPSNGCDLYIYIYIIRTRKGFLVSDIFVDDTI